MFYEKVEEYCKQKGLSVMAFEKMCDLSNGTVGKWKEGGFPSVPTLKKIEKATKVPVKKWLS